mmetsp:Transcript_26642/g.58640  ORF Transcript_26642/g.58640 Transcript_26642/m.58640 type:complete len:134 (+) Transcript_26642:1009-1410(+)
MLFSSQHEGRNSTFQMKIFIMLWKRVGPELSAIFSVLGIYIDCYSNNSTYFDHLIDKCPEICFSFLSSSAFFLTIEIPVPLPIQPQHPFPFRCTWKRLRSVAFVGAARSTTSRSVALRYTRVDVRERWLPRLD